MRRFFRDATDQHTACINQILHVGAADFRNLNGDEAIQAQALIFFVHGKFPMARSQRLGSGFGRVFFDFKIERIVYVRIILHREFGTNSEFATTR